MIMGKVILQTKKISKAFANKKVVSQVDFQVAEGEIVALLGENGAGKSTLKNMLVGLLKPTEGIISFDGRDMEEMKTGEAPIAAVHQELSLFLNLTVTENICIEHFPGGRVSVDWKKCHEEAVKYMRMMNINIDPDAIVGTLGPGEQQLIEIAKAIRLNPRVLILDEPTASLTTPEREQLFKVMNTLKQKKMGLIFITHFLDEVFQVCDRVVVLRNGVKVCDEAITSVNKQMVEEHMVGRSFAARELKLGEPGKETALKVRDFSSESFIDINFEVKKGEILGIAGLIGAGRTELLESIFGLRKANGTVEFIGEKLEKRSPEILVKKGMAMIPEDRKNCGIFPRRDLKENITCAHISAFIERKIRYLGFRHERKNAEKVLTLFKVSCPGIDAYITELSGGNQQKVIIGRWLSNAPAVCMFDDPTRGVDIGAKEEISNYIVEMAGKGTAVILVSSDFTELLSLSHRILVMRRGRIVGEVTRDQYNMREILSASSSKQKDEEAMERNGVTQ